MARPVSRQQHDEHSGKDGGFSFSVVIAQDEKGRGSFAVEVCSACSYVVHVECNHVNNSWNANGTVLTCNLCGADGT